MRRFALLTLLLLARPASAAFEDLGQGARAPGMGNAFTGIADDLYAVYYNPAGLAQLERPQLSAAYSKLYLGLSDDSDLGVSQLTYAHPLKAGRLGTVGGSWQRFSLNDIYTEQSIFLSWGRRVLRRDNGSQLLLGLSAKYLSRSFKQLPEAFNACVQGNCSFGADPVLTGPNSKSVIDADFGLLYRFPRRFQIGLLAQHVMKPNVGFSGSDKLPMNIRMGVGYKTLWMNLSGELRMDEAPSGKKDRDIVLGAERYFPTLEYGQFGGRASLGLGSRQWKQFTVGLSYRVNKIQTDYAFLLPFGPFKGTSGTHRLGMTFHFGAPTSEDQISQDLLLQAKRMQENKGPNYGYEFIDAMRPRDLSDPQLANIRAFIDGGQFRRAQNDLLEYAKDLPPDEALVRLSNRLSLAAYYYPELANPGEPWEVLVSSSVRNFLYGNDRRAVLQASYALSLNRQDSKLENYLTKLEEGVQIKAERLPEGHPRSFMEELLFRVEMANNRGEQEHVLALLKDISELSPDNVTALERMGSAYYVLGRFQDAADAWERALGMESDPRERAALMDYISKSREKLGQPGAPSAPVEKTPPAAAQEAPTPKPAPRNDPRDVERLYQKGVEHYARGEYLQATAMFMRILQIDPDNAPARKALQRIRSRQ